MKKVYLVLVFVCFIQTLFAQKVVHNPDCISQNIGTITKVELNKDETIMHFQVQASIGSWIFIPKETYIENASEKNTNRIYIKNTEGIEINKKVYLKNSDEIRYKLYFPPLPKDIKKINYGESNRYGNWFIYKLDLRKNGKKFITKQQQSEIEEQLRKGLKEKINFEETRKTVKYNPKANSSINTILPKDLPKDFFGNWYDKHGSLLLIATPDYMVSDKRIKYYLDIHQIGKNKYMIQTSSTNFEVLSLDDNTMTIRTNRLITLHKKKGIENVPDFLKGKWLHWYGVKEIDITDEYFYNNDKNYHGSYRDVIKNKIDYVAESNNGELIWFVLYNRGDYHIYFVSKNKDSYVLQPRGYANAKYHKVDNQ